MRRPLPALALLTVLGACSRPPDSAFVPVASGGSLVEVGKSAANEDCRMARSNDGGDIWCGAWETPAVRIRRGIGATAMDAATQARESLAARLDCAAPRRTTALGAEAALLDCRRRQGGWPAFVLASGGGGQVWLAEGVLPALPAAERGMAMLSGRASGTGTPLSSDAIALMAQRLAREAFSTGDIGQFDALMSIGRDANQAERFAAAETAYRAALGLQERVLGANQPDTFQPLVLLALQISNQGRHAEAEALFRRADALASRASDPLSPALLLHYRGLAEANRGRTDPALAALTRSGALYASYLPPELQAGGAALPVDRGTALAPLLVARDVVPNPLAQRATVGLIESKRNAAAILRAAGRIDEAELRNAEALRIANAVPGLNGANLIAARLQRTSGALAAGSGRSGAADRSFAASARRFALGVPRSRPYAETLLLRAAALGPESGETAGVCREAVAVLRSLREGIDPRRIAPCVDAFIAAGPTDQTLLAEAFEAAQLGQGTVTTTQIGRAAARLSESARNPAVATAFQRRETAERALAARYRERDDAIAAGTARGDLAALDAAIGTAEGEAVDADAALQSAAPGFAQLVQSSATTAETMAAMRPGEALLLLTQPTDRRGWSFWLKDGRIAAARIGADTAEIGRLVARIRAGVEDGSGTKPFDAAAAYALWQAVIGVHGPQAGQAGALLVVADGALLSLPFPVLVTAPPPQPRSHEGARFLLEAMPTTHLPSPASLVSLRRAGPSTAARAWVGYGAPRPIPAGYAARSFPAAPQCGQGLASLAALPGAELELRVASEITGAGAGERHTGAAFTLAALQHASLRDYRVVHFATHGVLPSDLACLSEPAIIASTAPNGPDASQALLTAGTVINLDLNADLVMLSACNSGGGAAAGESLSTLARSFFFAGARGLLLTHWYVNDIAAARIGAVMLLNMRNGDGSAEALQKAQLGVYQLRGGSHPAFWAPFALMGPGRTVDRTRTASAGTPARL
ncbi:MAG TPA: CHAT domain-containing tetratricopeptide repeat protein [Roseomonas sp.]